jgi:hypothetical protein
MEYKGSFIREWLARAFKINLKNQETSVRERSK